MKELSESFFVLDGETTGLPNEKMSHSQLAILELGAVDSAGRRFYRRIAMGRGRKVQQGALDCNGIDALDLGCGVSLDVALLDLLAWLRPHGETMRWIMGGKNPQFDYGFLVANWPCDAGVKLSDVISRRCVDLHSIVYGESLTGGVDMAADGFSTDDLYRLYGMEPEPKPHNALRGAIHEMEGFRRVLLGASAAMPQGQFDALMLATARENLTEEVCA